MRRAKIVCTMGPAVESPEKVRELIAAGMNMARLNLSHGGYEEHQSRLDQVRAAAKEAGKPVAILVDLQGPKIRLARFKAGPHDLSRGDIFTITTDDVEGTKERVGTTYKGLPGDCKPGDRILIDDGKVTVEVTEVKGNDVVTKVIEPGAVSNNKGINLPGVAVSVPALSEKDKEDLRWGLNAGADFIALSFVRSAEDIIDVHKIMDEVGIRVPVIAKIEKPQAVANLQEIVNAFDGIMVARGDLGVEIDVAETPVAQKRIIQVCREKVKPVIVATQMLESMHHNRRPTRAEASDVANAILDGADACMLSGETAIGEYPVESVEMMNRIMVSTERMLKDLPSSAPNRTVDRVHPVTSAVTYNAANIAESIHAKLVVVATHTGGTAWVKAKQRNFIPTLGVSDSPATLRRMALFWGIMPLWIEKIDEPQKLIDAVTQWGRDQGLLQPGDRVVYVTGTGMLDNTHNLLVVHQVPES